MHLPAIRQPTDSRLLAGSTEVLLTLIALCLSHLPALGDDASALIGRWIVPSREQEKSRMSPQCQRYAETEVQTVPEGELEILLTNSFAATSTI